MTSTLNLPEQAGRYLRIAAGGLLIAAGLRRGSLVGAALVLAGGGLLGAGLRGRGARALGFDRDAHRERYGAGVTSGIYDQTAQAAKQERHPVGELIEDIVEEASDDSFPCSDPPAWTAR